MKRPEFLVVLLIQRTDVTFSVRMKSLMTSVQRAFIKVRKRKMIDTLKEENDLFKLQLKESKEKLDENERDWRDKYDRVYRELQEAKEAIRTSETRILAQEHEASRQQNEWQSRLSELKVNMRSCETELDRKHCEVLLLQAELDSLRASLGQVETQQPRPDEAQIAIHDLSANIHSSCQRRIQDVSTLVRALIKQITDAGLSPCTDSLPEWPYSGNIVPVVSPSLRKPLSEISVSSNPIVTQSAQTDKGTDSDSSNLSVGDHNADGTTASVYWLSERLNAARRLILELGNQKLKQDALIAQLQASRQPESAERLPDHANSTLPLMADKPADTEALQRDLALVREQLNKQIDDYARLKKAYDILATTTQLGSLVSADNEDAITSISVSKSSAHVSVDSSSVVGSMTADLPTVSTPPRLSCSLNYEDVTNLDELVVANKLIESARNVSSPELSYTTLDVVEEAAPSPRDPGTIVPVLQSGDKPCGHSFVEMVNRSLCTSGMDASLLFSPGKPSRLLSEPGTHEDVAVGTSYLFVSGVARSDNSTWSEPNAAQLSHASATYGGVETILDNLELTVPKSTYHDKPSQKKSFASATGLNKTVSELRAYPDSPAPRASAVSKKSYYEGAFDKAGPHSPVSTFKSRLPISRLKADNVTMTNSFSENIGRLTEDMLPAASYQPLSVSFNLDERSDPSRLFPKPSLGDVTMVELQNKDLFERLARATAKLRDALDECAEAGSQLWTGDVSQCLSQLFTSQLGHENAVGAESAREIASHQSNESVQIPPPVDAEERVTDPDDKTPEQRQLDLNFSLTGCNGTVGPNHSVRFDRLGPCVAPSDFAQLSADSSLSQLYGSLWRAPESSYVRVCILCFCILCSACIACPSTPSIKCAFVERDCVYTLTQCEELRVQLDSLLSVGVTEKTQSMPNVSHPPKIESLLERFFSVGSSQLAAHVKHTPSAPIHRVLTPKTEIALQEYEAVVQLVRESDYAGFLEDSLPECMTALLGELKQLTERVASLTNQMAQMVPGVDHEGVLEQVVSLKQHLSDHEKKIECFEKQRMYILQRLSFLNVDNQSDNLAEAFDLLLTELATTRETLDQFDTERSDLRTQLESCVTKSDYDGKVKHLEQLTVEIYELRMRLDENQQSMDYVITSLSSLAPSEVASSLSTLTDWLVSELTKQRCTIDQLLNEQQQVYSTLSELLVSSIAPDTLMACVTSISQQVSNDRVELTNFRADRDKLLALFDGIGFATGTDALGCANAVVSALVEKQQALLEFEGFEEEVQETLRNSVPLADHEHVECELARICEDLTNTKAYVGDLEAELETVLQNSVSLDEYQRLQQQLNDHETRLTTSQETCNKLQAELRQLATIIPVDVTEGSLFERVDAICKELAERRQAVHRLEGQYEDVLTECAALKQQVTQGLVSSDDHLARIRAECDAQVAAYRDQMEAKLNARVSECDGMRTELGQYRARHHQLTEQLASREAEASQLLKQLADMEGTMQSLRATIVAKTESAQVATDALVAHEARASDLAIQLERLRSEHALCVPNVSSNGQSRLVDVQISPINRSRSAEELVPGDQRSESADMDLHSTSRLHKYSELKAVAFEIKEKLIQRTNKLEAALTEVARLRSVIRQDKEHASHILEEVQDLRKQVIKDYIKTKPLATIVHIPPAIVFHSRNSRKLEAALTEVARLRSVIRQDKEHASHILEEVQDLRKQAIRKNRRIHELESELNRIKSSAVKTDTNPPVSSARNTRSSTRTASELEQPRGAPPHRITLSHFGHNLDSSVAPSLLAHPGTPSINSTDFQRASIVAVDPDSTSLLFASPDQVPSRDGTTLRLTLGHAEPVTQNDEPVDAASAVTCRRCEALHNLVISLRSMITELQRQVDHDLNQEHSLLVTLDTLERQSDSTDDIPALTPSKPCSAANPETSVQSSLLSSVGSSTGDLKMNIKTLQHARSRLTHYAGEMDRICSNLARRLTSSDQHPAYQQMINLDELKRSLRLSVRSICRVRRRLKTLFNHMQPVDNAAFNEVIAELKTVIHMLTVDLDLSCLEPRRRSEDKENTPPVVETPQPVDEKVGGADLTRQAQRRRQSFLNLARALDSMTKELTQTTDVLVATRVNLEQQTGLSDLRPSSTN
ncbi:uncharacterized protein DEA37_0006635 [Paragonimus westermani]|uniref:DUF5741 domain-containing protein n=1 Tax=Paragonimus westermani TaxID=34504 RepID=A0A5J4NHS7_9TREM|nr:uncharacterized protein DEA37_0006635 [Paragonimus westermani]